MASNHLLVARSGFVAAVSVYGKKRAKLGPVLLSFDGGFLMVESGGIAKAMHAEGQWHGRATFSPEILRALAMIPPAQDPIPISYADGHLLIGNMTVVCQWESLSMATVKDLVNPGLVDLLALARTMPRPEILGTPLGKTVRSAGQSAISGEKLARIAAALEVTPDYFLSAEPAPSQSTAIQIPRGLAHAAEALDLTYAKTIRLLAGKDSLVARRSGSEEQEWSREDWIEFYKKVEPYL